MRHNVGDSFFLDGTYADWKRLWIDHQVYKRNPACPSLAVPQDTKRTSGDGANCGELYCECAWPRLGGNAGGAEGDGRA